MQNCSGGVDQDCIAAYSGSNDTWKCLMAQVYNTLLDLYIIILFLVYLSLYIISFLHTEFPD